MNLNFNLPKDQTNIIKVLGVGGGGSNAVNYMFEQGIRGVDFIVCNTDAQALTVSPVPNKIQLGATLTEGLGAGSLPEVGRNAAIENINDVLTMIGPETKMAFITAGMGGGTGTGAAPVIARACRERDILTVGIVTLPFSFEGKRRRAQAENGIDELRQNVDTLIVISNDKLRLINGNLGLNNAFAKADDVLTTAARAIAEIITNIGKINVDFADVKQAMKDGGSAIMGTAVRSGENRCMEAIEAALESPLLNDNQIKGARCVLINLVAGDVEPTLDEASEIVELVQERAGQGTDVFIGVGFDEKLGDQLSITVVATGFNTAPLMPFDTKQDTNRVLHTLDGTSTASNTILPLTITNNGTDFTKETVATTVAEKPVERTVTPLYTTPVNTTPVNTTVVNDNPPTPKVEERVTPTFTAEEPTLTPTPNKESLEPTLKSSGAPINFDPSLTADKLTRTVNPFGDSPKTPTPVTNTFATPVNNTPTPPPAGEKKESGLFDKSRLNISRMREMTLQLKTPGGLTDLEKQPAYERANVTLKDVPASDADTVAKYRLDETTDKRTELKETNPYFNPGLD